MSFFSGMITQYHWELIINKSNEKCVDVNDLKITIHELIQSRRNLQTYEKDLINSL